MASSAWTAAARRRCAGVAREHTLLVGDEIRDAKVSAEAGIDFGAVAWGFNTVDALMAQNPCRMFRAAGDLLEH
ncbi:HAD hydrolase-like protein [Rugamonas rivuli]|uniref:HAD hydrolase-like protein n=1 Tax=Rugamonas rivuli TaxID=2743358 RepID=UPI001F37DC25|nr:HAD hydrolase-like protein [Rugamonas rivuli]